MLADAMSYAQKVYSPKRVIDVATLTGAAMVALGEHAAAMFSNSPTMVEASCAANYRSVALRGDTSSFSSSPTTNVAQLLKL